MFNYTFEEKSKGKDQTNVGIIKKDSGFVLSNQEGSYRLNAPHSSFCQYYNNLIFLIMLALGLNSTLGDLTKYLGLNLPAVGSGSFQYKQYLVTCVLYVRFNNMPKLVVSRKAASFFLLV